MLVIVVILSFVTTAHSETKTYYEIWRSATDDPATAIRIEQWLTDANIPYLDDDPVLEVGQPYYYWIRALACEYVEKQEYIGPSDLWAKAGLLCPIYTFEGHQSPVKAYAYIYGNYLGNSTSERWHFSINEQNTGWPDEEYYGWDWPIYLGYGYGENVFEHSWNKDMHLDSHADFGEAKVYFEFLQGLFAYIKTDPVITVDVRSTLVPGPASWASQGLYADKIWVEWEPVENICSEIDATQSCEGWTKRTFTVTAECDPPDPSMGYVAPSSIQVLEGDSVTFTAYPNNGYEPAAWYLFGDPLWENFIHEQLGGTTYTVSDVNQNLHVYVTFQPQAAGSTTVTLNSIADTVISESLENNNYGSLEEMGLYSLINFRQYSLVKFSLSGIPGNSTINLAELKLYARGSFNPGNVDTWLEIPEQSWNESTVKWLNQPSTGTELSVFKKFTTPGCHTWSSATYPDLRILVQDWINGTKANNGFILTLDQGAEAWTAYYTREWGASEQRPKLVVTYTPPQNPPVVGDFVYPEGVNFNDFAMFASAWMSQSGDSNWDGRCDISEPQDNRIDMADLFVFASMWLEGTGAVTIYHDDFKDPLAWTVSNGSVYIKDNEYLYISADGTWDNGSVEKTFDINLMPDKQIIIEQRVKLESGGGNYRLPDQFVYFEDSSGLGVTYLPSGQGQSYGWHFVGWTGINQPEIPGENYWTVIRLVLTSTGGQLYMKPDDAAKEWFSGNFSFIASANWSHSKISKIKFIQPWDSVNYIDYITIKEQ